MHEPRRVDRRTRARRAWAAGSIGLVPVMVFGCTLARPLDYLTRGAVDAGDTAPSGDAALDALGHDANAPAKPFCTSQSPNAFFCADFDDGTMKNAYSKGGPISLVPPETSPGALAGPNPEGATHAGSLSLATPALSDGTTSVARLNTPSSSSTPTNQVVLEFSVRVDQFSAGTIGLVTVVFTNPEGGDPARAYYELGVGGDGISVEGTTFARTSLSPLAQRSWRRVRFECSLATKIRAQLFLDGAKEGEVEAPARYAPSAGASFLLGIEITSPSEAASILLDDIVFSPQPQ